jgi:Protein of unknown function (DUF2442)
MISLVNLIVSAPETLLLGFSDGSSGEWSASDVIARDTVLTRPLADAAYFARAFIEGEALAWPNGLEFSAMALQQKLDAAGALMRKAA